MALPVLRTPRACGKAPMNAFHQLLLVIMGFVMGVAVFALVWKAFLEVSP